MSIHDNSRSAVPRLIPFIRSFVRYIGDQPPPLFSSLHCSSSRPAFPSAFNPFLDSVICWPVTTGLSVASVRNGSLVSWPTSASLRPEAGHTATRTPQVHNHTIPHYSTHAFGRRLAVVGHHTLARGKGKMGRHRQKWYIHCVSKKTGPLGYSQIFPTDLNQYQ